MSHKSGMKISFNTTNDLLELTSFNFSIGFYLKDIDFDPNNDEDLYQLLDMIDGKTSTFECKMDADEHNSLEFGLDMEAEPALFRLSLQNIYDICVEYEDNKAEIKTLLQHILDCQNVNIVDDSSPEDNNDDQEEQSENEETKEVSET